MSRAPWSVFAILHPDRVTELLKNGTGSWREGKRWTTAAGLLADAQEHGEVLPVLIADAANDTSRLLASAEITHLEIAGEATEVHVKGAKPLERHRTQELLLRSTGAQIAEGFLRSYAIIHTPAFLEPSSPFVRRGTESPAASPTLFSYGYWGSGSGTDRLVRAVDEVERRRGFDEPLWVDIRINRAVRAEGFSGSAFERLVGSQRYVHLPDLGNQCVADGRDGIEIRRPAAAEDLLALAVSDMRRRVIFYCACDPIETVCHRFTVRDLLVKRARKEARTAHIIEWPGGEPWTVALDAKHLHTSSFALPVGMDEATAASIAWGTHGIVRTRRGARHVLLGPARFGKNGTSVPVAASLSSTTRAAEAARRWRTAHGCSAHTC